MSSAIAELMQPGFDSQGTTVPLVNGNPDPKRSVGLNRQPRVRPPMVGTPDTSTMIGSVPFFSGLDTKSKKALLAQGKEMLYRAGDTIVTEGTTGVGFYLILDGSAEVRKKGKVLATLSKGKFFGEMSLIDDMPRSADVVAIQPTKCWAITSWSFAALVKVHPDLALSMLKEVVKRLRAAQSSPTS